MSQPLFRLGQVRENWFRVHGAVDGWSRLWVGGGCLIPSWSALIATCCGLTRRRFPVPGSAKTGVASLRLVRQHFVLLTSLLVCGAFCLPILVMRWIGLEQLDQLTESRMTMYGWRESDLTGNLWAARVLIPQLAVSWVLLCGWMLRTRINSSSMAISAVTWMVFACAAVFLI